MMIPLLPLYMTADGFFGFGGHQDFHCMVAGQRVFLAMLDHLRTELELSEGIERNTTKQ